ncbi:MAG: hypothetical protein LC790_00765 [Actinobacteria bacterium]|nr:hypothetical protein [Actinomycetota bacterium]
MQLSSVHPHGLGVSSRILRIALRLVRCESRISTVSVCGSEMDARVK